MRSNLVKIAVMAGLLGAFGGIGLMNNFFAGKTQEGRIEAIVNDQELSGSQKVDLILAENLLFGEARDPTASLQFYKLGRECFSQSLRASDPKKREHLELASGYFRSASDELKKKPSKEQELRVKGDLAKAFQALEDADEPVKLPVSKKEGIPGESMSVYASRKALRSANQARVPSSRGRARELLRNSLRSFPDPDPVPNDAAWPPLRYGQTARSADRPREQETRGAQRGRWWPEEPIVGSEAGLFASRHVRCIIKQGSAAEPWPYTRARNLGSANQAAPADG